MCFCCLWGDESFCYCFMMNLNTLTCCIGGCIFMCARGAAVSGPVGNTVRDQHRTDRDPATEDNRWRFRRRYSWLSMPVGKDGVRRLWRYNALRVWANAPQFCIWRDGRQGKDIPWTTSSRLPEVFCLHFLSWQQLKHGRRQRSQERL